MQDQNKTPEKELSDTETSNLSDKEFKTLVIGFLMNSREAYMNLVRTSTMR